MKFAKESFKNSAGIKLMFIFIDFTEEYVYCINVQITIFWSVDFTHTYIIAFLAQISKG
jgi:hypothetical protein